MVHVIQHFTWGFYSQFWYDTALSKYLSVYWMIHPGAVLTSCHGKIGVFCIRMNKLMIYYLADISDTWLILAAGDIQKVFQHTKDFDIFQHCKCCLDVLGYFLFLNVHLVRCVKVTSWNPSEMDEVQKRCTDTDPVKAG